MFGAQMVTRHSVSSADVNLQAERLQRLHNFCTQQYLCISKEYVTAYLRTGQQLSSLVVLAKIFEDLTTDVRTVRLELVGNLGLGDAEL
jgi:hypothetical protein